MTKARFALISQEEISKDMSEIAKLNGKFKTIVWQVDKLRRANDEVQSRRERNRGASMIDVQKYAMIRETSILLHEALGKACTVHIEHSAHFCLQPNGYTPDRIEFAMAFGRPAAKAVWLTIESQSRFAKAKRVGQVVSIADEDNHTDLMAQINPSATITQPLMPKKKKKLIKKAYRAVCFEGEAVRRQDTDEVKPAAVVQDVSNSSHMGLIDLCEKQALCNEVRKCRGVSLKERRCIGFLKNPEKCQHIIYVDNSKEFNAEQAATLIETVRGNRVQGSMLPDYERIKLARLLALAALQFHASPWLENSWRSNHILLHDRASLDTQASKGLDQDKENPLYLEVRLRCQVASLKSRRAPDSLVRNETLFYLGVMLMEIATQRPFSELSSEGHDQPEFSAAVTASKTFDCDLGTTYREIIDKCLWCDFGSGEDLSQEKLQRQFHNDVVSELERLETQLRKLKLNF